jgi:hypothetical protein
VLVVDFLGAAALAWRIPRRERAAATTADLVSEG